MLNQEKTGRNGKKRKIQEQKQEDIGRNRKKRGGAVKNTE